MLKEEFKPVVSKNCDIRIQQKYKMRRTLSNFWPIKIPIYGTNQALFNLKLFKNINTVNPPRFSLMSEVFFLPM